MNRTKRTVAVLAAGVTLASGWAWAGIEGSKHDFTSEAWSGGELCSACHTPHRTKAPTAAPLWNPDADLNRTFGAYRAKKPSKTRPGSGTLACLRCHDGTLATPVAAGVKSRPSVNKQHRGSFTAGHKTTDHPVGVDYPRFAKGFRAITAVLAKGVALPAGKVECISCHDPHNQAGIRRMLATSNARSALCLTCHKK